MDSDVGNRKVATRDLIWVVTATLGFAALCAWFELSERILAWTKPQERFQLDELPGVLLFLASALAWYAWRRIVEARTELGRREQIEARLRDALAQNRDLAQASVRIQEEERRFLARELHDELGQYLNALKIDAVCLRDGDAGRITDVRAGAESIVAMTDHLERVVRELVRRLRPPGLDELGLPAALENCVEGWRRRLPDVQFTMVVEDDLGMLDEATNITLYRLVQEGLTNIAKHARARNVEIRLQRCAATPTGVAEVVLTLRDDGVGARTGAKSAGLGIAGMRERVESLAGRFDLAPARGDGFGFTAWLPMPPAVAG
ncbi:MAG TPA: sensor histidine kinase [Casimicrobiaceae bacterium]